MAWITAHASDCSWRSGREGGNADANESCTCGAVPEQVDAEYDSPSPAGDARGFVCATRRAVIATALEGMKGED